MSARDEVEEMLAQIEEQEDTPTDVVRQLTEDWHEMRQIIRRMAHRIELIKRHQDTYQFLELERFKQAVKDTIDEL